jgi:hypothetical protein
MIRNRTASFVVAILGAWSVGCAVHLSPQIPLAPTHATDASKSFAQIFCSVLAAEPISGPQGAACSEYLQPSASPGPPPPVAITSAYRLLLVGGYMSQCITGDVATFSDAVEHLETVHQVVADIAPVSALGSSTYNAKMIDDFVSAHFPPGETRPYIAVGYSKGTPDLMEALAAYPALIGKFAALVTFAGVVKGSRLAGAGDKLLDDLFAQLHLTGCSSGDGGGLVSMQPDTRNAFLNQHPHAFVPTYSLVASSTLDSTSTVLLPTWSALTQYRKTEDSQMIDVDAVAPEAQYLGMALADHWAIAIPFERSTDAVLKDSINHNHFPRPQLFESILRYVVADLQKRSSQR